jgi:hypothetical protein
MVSTRGREPFERKGRQVIVTTRQVLAAGAIALAYAACTSTVPSAGGVAGARAAIVRYEAINGPPPGSWRFAALVVSAVDPTFVIFLFGPRPGLELQGAYGFAREQNGTWRVIGLGSAGVGCPPGAPGNEVVPAAVLSGFGLSCPGAP